MTNLSSYFIFLDALASRLSSNPSRDYGLMTAEGIRRAYKAVGCLHRRPDLRGVNYPCGVCEVCRGSQVYRQFQKVSRRMFSSLKHDYYSVILSLPTWPDGIAQVGGCKSFGELFFVTPSLFDAGKEVLLNGVLSGLRRTGVEAIQGCFPGMKLGLVACLHLVNDYMMFSPHLHVILCGTAMDNDFWPLEMDQAGRFPALGQAWRTVLGGRRGMSARRFGWMLHERWVELLSSYCMQTFDRYRGGFRAGVATKNVAYGTFSGMTAGQVEALGPLIRRQVMSDPRCVQVKRIAINPKTGKVDLERSYKYATKYALRRAFRDVEFRDLGGGMVSAQVVKDGERRYAGDLETLQRRMLQYLSVSRVRKYEGYGLFHAGCGKVRHQAFVKVVNEGYPR